MKNILIYFLIVILILGCGFLYLYFALFMYEKELNEMEENQLGQNNTVIYNN